MWANEILEVPFTEYAVEPYPGSSRKKKVLRPIIPLTLLYKERMVQFAALLDSGADYNLFHADIALYLGIPLIKGSRVRLGGIGGYIKGYLHMVTVKFGSYMFRTKIAFSNQLPETDVAVLGMQGFFSECTVVINYPHSIHLLRK